MKKATLFFCKSPYLFILTILITISILQTDRNTYFFMAKYAFNERFEQLDMLMPTIGGLNKLNEKEIISVLDKYSKLKNDKEIKNLLDEYPVSNSKFTYTIPWKWIAIWFVIAYLFSFCFIFILSIVPYINKIAISGTKILGIMKKISIVLTILVLILIIGRLT